MQKIFGSGKKQRFLPYVPEWETHVVFDPTVIEVRGREPKWVDYRGTALQPPFRYPSAEEMVAGKPFNLEDLACRDTDYYLTGGIHEHVEVWEKLGATEEIMNLVKNGVDVDKYFRDFKGNFKGKSYDNDSPAACSIYLPNSSTCIGFEQLIVDSLLERVSNGSLSVAVEVDLPHLVMPFSIEPSKPRLCHDERLLNLWICDLPFQLDTLKKVPRVVPPECFMTSIDDKSVYDHIRLTESSRKYFGVQYGGWYFQYNTLAVGFKASAYNYHTAGLTATSYCRSLGVPCLHNMDDRLLGQLLHEGVAQGEGNSLRAMAALYATCEALIRLGYFIGFDKTCFEPCQVIRFLGMLVDGLRQAFRIPEDNKSKFVAVRDTILNSHYVDLKMLQRFAGKCISLMLAVPPARLCIREINRAICVATKNSKPI